MAFDTITNATGTASTATAYDTITKASGAVTAPVVFDVTLGLDIGGIEPYTTVPVVATLINGGGATLLLEQTGGDTAPISGTGPNWTYVAPAVLAEDGSHLIFRVTATLGAEVRTAEVDHFVYPNTVGAYTTAGQLVPVRVTDTVDAVITDIVPDAGVFPDTGARLSI